MRTVRGSALTWALFAIGLAACDGDPEVLGPDDGPGEPDPDPPVEPFLTAEPAMAEGLDGAELTPILSVGDSLPVSGLAWAPIPDGIGAWAEDGEIALYVNHELSSTGVELADGGAAFEFARVSALRLDPATLGVISGSYAVDGTEGYERLCSASWATGDQGFPGGMYLTGEETVDGEALAIDAEGTITDLPWFGKWAKENIISVPGFANDVVLIGLDDRVAASELYMYRASSGAEVLTGGGTLYVFASEESENVGDLREGDRIRGTWIEVTDPASLSGAEMQARVEDLGAYPFVRLEDGEHDKSPQDGNSPAIFFADSGEPSHPSPDAPWDSFGSIYRMEFDPADPTGEATLILLARSRGHDVEWASPDNVATSLGSLMVQEDPSYVGWNREPRIYQFSLAPDGGLRDRSGRAVVRLLDPTCPAGVGGCWESSGIIDTSHLLGPGTWIFDVQAHSRPEPRLGLAGSSGQLLFLNLPGS
jgi:hypothetical protein